MNIPTTISVPDYVYRFYQSAAKNIAEQTTEQLMADALTAYAALLNADIMKTRNNEIIKDTGGTVSSNTFQAKKTD